MRKLLLAAIGGVAAGIVVIGMSGDDVGSPCYDTSVTSKLDELLSKAIGLRYLLSGMGKVTVTTSGYGTLFQSTETAWECQATATLHGNADNQADITVMYTVTADANGNFTVTVPNQ